MAETAERSRCNFACPGIDKGSLCMVRGSSIRGDSKITCALKMYIQHCTPRLRSIPRNQSMVR